VVRSSGDNPSSIPRPLAILPSPLSPLRTRHRVMVLIKRRRATDQLATTPLPKLLLLKLCMSLPTLALGATLGLSP